MHRGISHLAIVTGLMLAALSPHAAAAANDYVVTLDRELSRIEVQANITAGVEYLTTDSRLAPRLMDDLRDCDGSPLRLRGRRIALDGNGRNCVRYSVALSERVSRFGGRRAPAGSDYRVTSPSDWLWLPASNTKGAVTVNIRSPDGVNVSAPWIPAGDAADNRFIIPRSPGSADSTVIFGRFPRRDIAVPGGGLRAAFPGIDSDREVDKLSAWLRDAATNVAQAYGQFPNPSPQVVVMDTGTGARSAVSFGVVVRNGGEAINYYVDAGADPEALRDDWTATHEFSHLLLPYVNEKWVSEGFATYHQNILLGRAGVYDEEQVWERLLAGFARGRASVPHLSPSAASRGRQRGTRMKVYWAGVVLALMADVELRERHPRQSLGTLLAALQRCCLPAKRGWRVTELFAKLDSFADSPVLLPLYEQYANRPGFPDAGPLLRRLGVRNSDGRIAFDDDAELASVRKALTASGASS